MQMPARRQQASLLPRQLQQGQQQALAASSCGTSGAASSKQCLQLHLQQHQVQARQQLIKMQLNCHTLLTAAKLLLTALKQWQQLQQVLYQAAALALTLAQQLI
jgi:hypothetical protein